MTFPFARSQATATRIIKRWGGPKQGYFIRAGARRPAWMARLEYKPEERDLYVDGAERLYVSVEGLKIAPEQELDFIEYGGFNYRILKPPLGPRPNGTVIYYDLAVIKFQP